MSEPQPVGSRSSDAGDSSDDLIDGTSGDGGEQDTTLTTDDEAQDGDDVVKPGNS